ncbi:DctP family TRAP transporter solute-binding subunit [Aliikangiella sp. IMCC44632]
MLKKIFLVCFLGILCSCEPNPPESKSSAQKTLHKVLKFGHSLGENSPQHRAAVKFANRIEKATKSQIKVEVYPNQSLGNAATMLAGAQAGTVDFILAPSALLGTLAPKLQLLDLPFLFNNHDAAHQALDGQIGNSLLAQLRPQQLIGLSFWESGFKQITSKTPITQIEDFKQQKFRVMQSAVLIDQFEFWGSPAIAIDIGNVKQALEDNVITAQENPLLTLQQTQINQAQKHLLLSNHGYLAQVLIISEKTFQSLTQPQQNAIVEAAIATTASQREDSQSTNQKILANLDSLNLQPHALSPQLKKALVSKARHLLEKYRMSIGTELVEQAIQIGQNVEALPKEDLIIALDADMSGNSALSGLAIRRGIELAIEEINTSGGVLGKSLTLTVRDNSMIPAKGLDNLKQFKKIPNLAAVFGGISSPVVLSELDFIHQNKLLFLNPWAAATNIVDNGHNPNFIFRVSVRDEFAGEFLLNEALKISSNVGLLLVNNPWGRGNKNAIQHALSAKNLSATSLEWFDWGESNFDKILQRMKASGSEVIIYVGNPNEAANMVKSLALQESPPAVISHWGITGSEFHKLAGDALEKIDLRVLQTYSFIHQNGHKAKQLVKRYKEKYFIKDASEIVAPTGTAHAYDLTYLLAAAIRSAKSIDSDLVRQHLEKIPKYNGLIKSYSPPFTPNNHDALSIEDLTIAHYKNGNLVPLE